GEAFVIFERTLKERIQTLRNSWHTTKNYGKKMLCNALENLPSVLAGTPLDSLRDQFIGIPAVCIAAGPSLDNSLPWLKEINNRALIIGCDSSVNALLASGVRPHVVVTTDIFEVNFEKVKSHVDELRGVLLIYGIESNPNNVRKYLGPKRVVVSAGSKLLLEWLDKKWDLNCRLPSLASVSHTAIFAALALGADPIVMVGTDLSHPAGRSHAAGSIFQADLHPKDLIEVQSVKGTQVYSSPQLIADKVFLEDQIAKSLVRFVNTSLDGARIKGAEVKSLDEILATDLKDPIDVPGRLAEMDWTSAISPTAAVDEFEAMLQRVVGFQAVCHRQQQVIEAILRDGNDHLQTNQLAGRFAAIRGEFENFQQNNRLLFDILEIAVGEDIHAILKDRERIAAQDYRSNYERLGDELDLIGKHYRAYGKAAAFFHDRLYRMVDDLRKTETVRQGLDPQDNESHYSKHLELGRHWAATGEIWQAEREYHQCVELKPHDCSLRLELARIYIDSQLWGLASKCTQEARDRFPDVREVEALQSEIETKIAGMMDTIKENWVSGDKEKTRRLLNEYLLLRPEDEQANLLKTAITALDRTLAADLPFAAKQLIPEAHFDVFLQKAAHCIAQLEFEEAIGILEGLLESFPGRAAIFREKIGDCRMLQRDFGSAVWNYAQARQMGLPSREITAKIDDARQQLDLSAQNSTARMPQARAVRPPLNVFPS
ncbi:MAG: DUF115 domain-containing protein, partial [Desulfobacterales bacterium]